MQPSSIRDRYTQTFNEWLAATEAQVRRDGMEYLRVIAGEPLEPVLRRFLVGRRGAN